MYDDIPNDMILFISGVSCVGKTTTAYNILKALPKFRRVSEVDILRLMAKSLIHELEKDLDYVHKAKIQNQYCSLFQSITQGDLTTLKKQSKILQTYVREIVKRQQYRKIPTIIEGISIVPSTYFYNNRPIDGFENNIIFINLYLSNEKEHLERRISRCKEREYKDDIISIQKQIKIIRKNKNYLLHKETLKLSKKVDNVFSIDISGLSQDSIIEEIIKIIYKYINL